MQWVSTFASGASSLGRSRRLEVRPAESGPPSSRGKFGENSPHLLGNIEDGKSKKKTFTAWIITSRTIDVPRTPVARSF